MKSAIDAAPEPHTREPNATRPGEPPATAPGPGLNLVRRLVTVFLPFAGGYFLSYLFRSTNAIIAPDLARDIGLGAADLGLVTAAYAFAFAAVQIPLGLMLDRFGPRRVQACLLLSAAAGAFVFSTAESRETLIVGRALIGLGVAGGLMASFKAVTQWFAPERWPLVNGFVLATGGLGALAATAPLEAALQVTGWRSVFAGLALVTVAVSALIFLAVPERRSDRPADSLHRMARGIAAIYGSRHFWRYAPICITTLAANMAIQTLWAGPWFRDVASLGREAAADRLALLAIMMTAGFVATGALPAVLRRRRVPIDRVMTVILLVFLAAQGLIAAEVDAGAAWPWIVFGLTMNIAMLAYPILASAFPLDYAGRVNTALNLLVFSGFFAAQWGMGAVIDLWPVGASGGYRPEAYRAAFASALGLQILAFLWYLVPMRRAT